MDDHASQEASPNHAASTDSAGNTSSFDPRDLIPTALFCASPEGRLAWMNSAAEELTGRSVASIVGEPFSLLIPEESRRKVARHMLRQRRRGITDYYVEAPLATAGVESRWVGLHVRLATASNGHAAFVCTAHDLQEIHSDLEALRRRNRELAARLEEATSGAELKSSFLATMSSELRAPMNGVIGMSRLLLDSRLDRDQRTWTEVIQASGQQLLELVDDILDYSRIESGQLAIGNMDFDLRVTVDAVASLLSSRAQEAGIQLTSLVHHRVPSLISGDPGRLRQVLLELAECALDQAEGGEVQIRAELVEETAHQAVVRFWVNRVGGPLGGAPDVEQGLLAAYDGTDGGPLRLGARALGLTIGRRIVALMGGDAGATLVPDLGSRLWFRIPFGKQVERPESVPASPVSGQANIADLRVLVVDQDPTARIGLKDAVGAWGGSCDEAEGNLEAIERMRAGILAGTRFGAVLADLDATDLDARGFAEAVRADAALASTPLVLLTSFGRPGDAARAESWGYNAYFVKPVDSTELRVALADLLARDAASGGQLVTRHTVAEMKKRGIRVLVVESNPIDQLVIASALRRVGLNPEMVGSVSEATISVARQSVDIVFIDMAAGSEDGYEQARILRSACDSASGPSTRTPVVGMAGRVREEEMTACAAAGIDELLSKPVDLEALVATVGRWVDEHGETASENSSAVLSQASDATSPVSLEEPALTEQDSVVTESSEWASSEEVAEYEAETAAVDDTPPVEANTVAEFATEPAAASISDLPVLDASSLESAPGWNAAVYALLVEAFLSRARQPVDRLKRAAEWSDLGAVEFQARTIRGLCEAVGARRCAAVLAEIEEHAAGGRLDEAVAGMPRLDAELEAVRRASGDADEGTVIGDDSEVSRAA